MGDSDAHRWRDCSHRDPAGPPFRGALAFKGENGRRCRPFCQHGAACLGHDSVVHRLGELLHRLFLLRRELLGHRYFDLDDQVAARPILLHPLATNPETLS